MFQAHKIFMFVFMRGTFLQVQVLIVRYISRQKTSEPVHKMSRLIAKQQEGIDWVFSSVHGLALFMFNSLL